MTSYDNISELDLVYVTIYFRNIFYILEILNLEDDRLVLKEQDKIWKLKQCKGDRHQNRNGRMIEERTGREEGCY